MWRTGAGKKAVLKRCSNGHKKSGRRVLDCLSFCFAFTWESLTLLIGVDLQGVSESGIKGEIGEEQGEG